LVKKGGKLDEHIDGNFGNILSEYTWFPVSVAVASKFFSLGNINKMVFSFCIPLINS